MLGHRLKVNLGGYGFLMTFFGSLFICIINIYVYMRQQTGIYANMQMEMDVSNLFAAFQGFILWENASLHTIYKNIFPILSILPGAFLYVKEYSNGEYYYLILREGKRKYFLSTIINAVISSFLAITIPLVFSTILLHLLFPEFGRVDYGFFHMSMNLYILNDQMPLLFPGIFINSPFLSTLLSSVGAGFLAGIYTAVTVMISFFLSKSRPMQVTLILPIFLLSYASDVITRALGKMDYNPIQFVLIELFMPKNVTYVLVILIILITFIIIGLRIREEKDVF
ncbi:ABC-2 family transporter protein [Clostridiales bacterium CHKCI001]|nr:ABC-2 family transporter protein [Clostridiales bacterium CHKCI001]